MVRQGLRSILTGYADLEVVAEAGNGIDALSAVEAHRPAVVIMDINMPKMDGIEATRRIKARYHEISVIGLSVNTADENRQAMLQAGAAMLLNKESAVDQLYNAIQGHFSPTGVERNQLTIPLSLDPNEPPRPLSLVPAE